MTPHPMKASEAENMAVTGHVVQPTREEDGDDDLHNGDAPQTSPNQEAEGKDGEMDRSDKEAHASQDGLAVTAHDEDDIVASQAVSATQTLEKDPSLEDFGWINTGRLAGSLPVRYQIRKEASKTCLQTSDSKAKGHKREAVLDKVKHEKVEEEGDDGDEGDNIHTRIQTTKKIQAVT